MHGYYDKNRPTCQQMQKLAIHVSAGNPKPVGFKVGAGFGETTVRVVEDEDDCDEDEEDKKAPVAQSADTSVEHRETGSQVRILPEL